MTTTGRRSGEARDVPVSPIIVEGTEFVVSPYGEVGWVHNVRAHPMVTLSHGSKHRPVRLEEVADRTAASAVAAYYAREGHARPYMDVSQDPTIEDFASKAELFPVFKVVADSIVL